MTLSDISYTEHLYNLLHKNDPDIFNVIEHELKRQHNQIELIASENFVSSTVLGAMGSILTNKYAEGYPNARYYGGCVNVDQIENIAIERACKLFGCKFANVQPHSGCNANLSVFYAFLKPGDTFLGMDLAAGGHLTHGAKPTISGKWFNPISYGVCKETGLIDYEQLEKLTHEHNPKLIIAGGSSYPRNIDFEKFGKIAKSVGAILMADIAHYAGLIASGLYPNPFPYADVATTTTHKTLRGPRGGMILWNNEEFNKSRKVGDYVFPTINGAVFPGVQGGPLMHVIAGKAVAFGEALQPSFKIYSQNVIENATILAAELEKYGAIIMTGGTDSHMVIADVHSKWGVSGREAEEALERAGITCNKNAIPFDTLPIREASGIRLGSPAATSRGFKAEDFKKIAFLIYKALKDLKANGVEGNKAVEEEVLKEIHVMCTALVS